MNKDQWPYSARWWPKNFLQLVIFELVWLTLCLVVVLAARELFGRGQYDSIWLLWTICGIGLLGALAPVKSIHDEDWQASRPKPEPVRAAPPIVAQTPPPIPVIPAQPQEPFQPKLEARLRAAIIEHDYAIPPKQVMDVVLAVGESIYSPPTHPPLFLQQPRPETHEQAVLWDAMIGYWQNREHNLFEAIVTSLSMYLSKLPRFCPAPFQRAFQPTGQLLYQMMLPFRQVHFKALDMPLTHRFDENTGIYSRTVKDAVETLWPHRYQGPPEQMAETYLKGTHFLPLFQVLVPYTPFTDEQRFTHHWCLGDTGTGKTTYLRHFIQHDLERAAEGGCSLVVIDSKKLIREGLRTLKIFTEKLDGCMTLVDADTPFPLNPFHLPKPMAIAVISYMLAGLSDASKLQTGVLRWYAEAAYHTGKSLETILEYMRWNGKDPLSDLDRFPDDVRNWFLKTRKGVHSATSSGIEQRLADFLRDNKDKLGRMFAADSWGLDLMQLHEGGRVWLIDTNRHAFGKDGANLLGRLMIALIDNLSSYRTTMNADTLKPLLVVIDEAQDYIEKDEIFADILEKARAQKIGITVAHHFEGQIDQRIQLSLRQGGIKTQCVDAGKPVEIKTRRESFTLSVPPLEFSKRHDLQMTQDDYDKMRELMAFHHPYKPTRTLRVVPDEDIEEPKHYA